MSEIHLTAICDGSIEAHHRRRGAQGRGEENQARVFHGVFHIKVEFAEASVAIADSPAPEMRPRPASKQAAHAVKP